MLTCIELLYIYVSADGSYPTRRPPFLPSTVRYMYVSLIFMAPAGSGDDSYISDLTLPDFTTSYNVLRLETGSMMSGDLITRLVWRRSRIETTFT